MEKFPRWTMRIVLLAILFAAHNVLAQTWSESPILQEARSAAERDNWSLALKKAQQARERLPAVRDALLVSEIEGFLGDCHLELEDYQRAWINYAQAYSRLRRMQSPPPELLADIQNKIGNYHLERQEFDLALTYLDSALSLRLDTFDPNGLKVADSYYNLATAYVGLGDFSRAQELYSQAYQVRRNHPQVSSRLIAQSLNALGICAQDAGDLERSEQYLRDALSIYQSMSRPPNRALVDTYLNLGNILSELAYDTPALLFEARQHYHRALEILDSGGGRRLIRALLYNNLANLYVRFSQVDAAKQYYQRALDARQKILGDKHPEVAQTYYNLGLSQMQLGVLDQVGEAFKECEKALGLDELGQGPIEQVNDHWTLLKLRYLQTELAWLQYEQDNDLNVLSQAFEDLSVADQVIDFLYANYNGIGTKQDLIATSHSIYEQAIHLAAFLKRATNKDHYAHRAFYYSEKSKSALLLEAVQKSKAETFTGIPKEVIQEIRDAETELADLDKKRFLNQDLSLADSLGQQVFYTSRKIQKLIEDVAAQYPAYYQLRYETVPPTVSEIKSTMDSDQTLISYFLGSEHLWIFVINKDVFTIKEIKFDSEAFYSSLQAFIASIRDLPQLTTDEFRQSFQSYTSRGRQFYNLLIKPIDSLLTQRLVVVPDGILSYLPYEALITDDSLESDQFKFHPYLIRNHAINYNYSCRLMLEMGKKTEHSSAGNYLGFAPEFVADDTLGLATLSHNSEEVLAADEIFSGEIVLGQAATKAKFLESHSEFQILHLATHGLANNESEDFSFIAFTNAGDQADQNRLYVREIFNLQCPAEMILLSACETGTGRLYEGEGIASIARGFAYAGARSLVATRWNINDRTTARLIKGFLGSLKSGTPKDLALQEATLEFIKSGNQHYAHPFYWSAFMQIGHMDAIKFKPDVIHWKTSALIILGMALLVFIGYQIKRHRALQK